MKPIYATILLLAVWQTGFAQQEPLYTQFMYNKLAWNPAYAGSYESPALTLVYRNQYIGLQGAPKTAAISFSQPVFRARWGFGGNLVAHSIGITRILQFDAAVCYRIALDYGTLAVGFSFSARQFYQDWKDDRLLPLQGTDPSIPTDKDSKIIMNVGTGIYYKPYNAKWYAGIALPRIFENSIDFSAYADGEEKNISREVKHFNGMGGYTFVANPNLNVTPQVLLKYVKGAPAEADINVTLLLRQKFTGGLTYRTGGGETSAAGESIDVLFGLQATEKIFACLSYDLGLTPLRKYHSGSVELTCRYVFNPPPPENAKIIQPY